MLIAADNLAAGLPGVATEIDAALLRPLPTGQRAMRSTAAQRQGILLHTLLQHLSASSPGTSVLHTADGIQKREMADMAALQLQFDISSSDQDD